ncbi:hypothetical protein BD410DRAFT_179317 [Rickenella mellea]|uniref:Uncharacterized protein n=1 Tax=Rickenella mellea TaxID=50990 RepID=A0A4Y7Q821_9AGAM|nr:hypothetical protein BD410DRAFT_179317 [Rickenella mellea]
MRPMESRKKGDAEEVATVLIAETSNAVSEAETRIEGSTGTIPELSMEPLSMGITSTATIFASTPSSTAVGTDLTSIATSFPSTQAPTSI